jgi:hypothetical protein
MPAVEVCPARFVAQALERWRAGECAQLLRSDRPASNDLVKLALRGETAAL